MSFPTKLICVVLIASAPCAALGRTLTGTWRSPAGIFSLKQSGDTVVGTLVAPAKGCTALAKGAKVLRGTVLDDTFSGQVQLCLQGPKCVTHASWLTALLMADAGSRVLSGAIERGNAACHAQLPGKGGIAFERIGHHGSRSHRRSKLDPIAVAKARALLKMGQAYLQAGNPEVAISKFQAAAAIAPLPEAYNGIGVCHYFRHAYRQALAAYQKAIGADPDFGDAYYNIACIDAVTGKKDLAFKFLKMSARDRYHDFSKIDDDPDLMSLHGDPRYAEVKKLASGKK